MRRKRARIIFTRSGRGLVKDARLLQDLLRRMGWRVSLRAVSSNRFVHRSNYYRERLLIRLPQSLRRLVDQLEMALGRPWFGGVDLQIHLETVFANSLGAGSENWLIPNQEWANMHQLRYLSHLSRILCKTQAAVAAYSPFNPNVSYIGFSNTLAADLPGFSPEADRFRRFLHVAGNNRKKGSAAVMEAWRRNPAWPNLDFVVEQPARFHPIPANVTVWQAISDRELDGLRMRCGLVVAPSEVEGFGHAILEAMAWGAVAITTDAEPMNELVDRDRGKLVPWRDKQRCRLGYRYHVSVEDLEAVINEVIRTPQSDLMALAGKARDWVAGNHQRFETAFAEQVAGATSSGS